MKILIFGFVICMIFVHTLKHCYYMKDSQIPASDVLEIKD